MRIARHLFPIGLLALAACIPSARIEKPVRRAQPPARSLPPATTAVPQPRLAQPRLAQAPPDRPEAPPAAPSPPAPFETRRVTPDARSSVARIYHVRRGDTLRAISDRTGAGSEAIARENGLKPPFIVRAGRVLHIPAGRWHRVRASETGIGIARAYGVEWSRVAALNHLAEPYILRTGERLLLPSVTEVADMSVEDRARTFDIGIADIITGGEPAIGPGAEPAQPVPARPRARRLPANAAIAPPHAFDGRFDWPLTGAILRGFGPFGQGRRNDGIDIGAEDGAPIVAAADGVVSYAGTGIAAYGGLILIRHADAFTTAYGHAAELLVRRGQTVRRGQVIGRAGATGHAEAPELHFEIRMGAKPVDPLGRLPPRS